MPTPFLPGFPDAAMVALGPPVQEMVVTVGAGSLKSAAIAGDTKKLQRVRLFSDTDCFVTWNADPTAVGDGSSGRALAAEVAEYFEIEAEHFVAVIERV